MTQTAIKPLIERYPALARYLTTRTEERSKRAPLAIHKALSILQLPPYSSLIAECAIQTHGEFSNRVRKTTANQGAIYEFNEELTVRCYLRTYKEESDASPTGKGAADFSGSDVRTVVRLALEKVGLEVAEEFQG